MERIPEAYWLKFSEPGWARTFAEDLLLFGKESPDGKRLWPHQAEFLEKIPYEPVDWRASILKSRQIGMSYAIAMSAVAWAFCHRNSKIYGIATKLDQATILVDYAQELVARNPLLHRLTKPPFAKSEPTLSTMWFSSGSRFRALPLKIPKGDNVRGIVSNFTIVDEGAFMPNDAFDAILPTTALTHGPLVLVSTAGYSKICYFYNAHYKSEIYEKMTFDGKMLYSKEDLDRKRKEMGNPLRFEREYLCKWLTSFRSLFPDELLDPCFRNNVRKTPAQTTAPTHIGIDFGESIHPTVVSVVVSGRPASLVYHKAFIPGTPFTTVISETVDLARKYRTTSICADAIGVGTGPTQDLSSTLRFVEAVKWTQERKTEDMFALRRDFEDTALIVDEKETELREELRNYEVLYTKQGRAQFDFPVSDDRIDSLALAMRAARHGRGFRGEATEGWGFGRKST